jgi:hypothetical protein
MAIRDIAIKDGKEPEIIAEFDRMQLETDESFSKMRELVHGWFLEHPNGALNVNVKDHTTDLKWEKWKGPR